MTHEELTLLGFSLSNSLGAYGFYEKGTTPTAVVLLPDGTVRIAKMNVWHSNSSEYLRDLALNRILTLVSALPGVVQYPTVTDELGMIANGLAQIGDLYEP